MEIRDGIMEDLNPVIQMQMDLAYETENGLKLNKNKLKLGVEKCLLDNDNNNLKPFYIVASIDNNIVGFIGISPEWSDWWGTEYWWVISIFVKSQYRRKGVATKLFQYVLNKSKMKNIQTVNLRVEKLNANAIAFYKTIGFVIDDSHHVMSIGKKPDGSTLTPPESNDDKDNDVNIDMKKEMRRKRKQEQKKNKLEKLKKKQAREGNGVFHPQKTGSTMNLIFKDYILTWEDYLKENLNGSKGGNNSSACPSILLINVMYEGNIGAIVRNCYLSGFTRILLFSSSSTTSSTIINNNNNNNNTNATTNIYTSNFLKGIIRKSTCMKYNWKVKLVIGLPSDLQIVSNAFHACNYQLVALWGLDEEKRRDGHNNNDEMSNTTGSGNQTKRKRQQNLWDVNFNKNKKVVLIGGNENNGIPGDFAQYFDTLAFVPSIDKETGAYNISHALHLASYEAFRSWK